MKKRLATVAMILGLILMQFTAVYAGTGGSLTVELKNSAGNGDRFKDFNVSIWRVADSSFNATAEFAPAGIDWNNIDYDLKTDNGEANKTIANALHRIQAEFAIVPTAQAAAGADGKASFSSLADGIYLVTATDSRSPARYVFTDFVVMIDGSGDVVAAPKGEPHYTPDNPNTPNPPPPKPDDVTPVTPPPSNPVVIPPSRPPTDHVITPDGNDFIELDDNGTPLGRWHYDDDKGEWIYDEFPPLTDLPQTGALRWPVPVLTGSGIMFMALGYKVNRGKKQR